MPALDAFTSIDLQTSGGLKTFSVTPCSSQFLLLRQQVYRLRSDLGVLKLMPAWLLWALTNTPSFCYFLEMQVS